MNAQYNRSLIEQRLREEIPEACLRFTFARSGGPGGQNVNKVASRVTLWFDLDGDPALTPSEKARLRSKLAGRINAQGMMFVVSMRHRKQAANRRAAVERFYELLADALTVAKPRRKTVVPARAKRRRLKEKQLRSERKEFRGPVRNSE
jgi:ribosome-associated protein